MKIHIRTDDPNLLKTPGGWRGKNGTRYCTKCQYYMPHHNTKAVAPWECLNCRPRKVKK